MIRIGPTRACTIRWALLALLCSLASLRASQPVLIVSNEYLPYSSKQHHGSGVVLDLARAALATQDVTVTFEFAPWKRCESMVANGTAFAAAPYFLTPERQQQFDFSAPLVLACNRFFYHRDTIADGFTWQTLADFQGYRMGGSLGFWYLPAFRQAGLMVEEVPSDQLNLGKLVAQRLDFIVLDHLIAQQLLQSYSAAQRASIAMLDKPQSIIPLHLLISRSYPGAKQLTEQLDRGLRQLKASGAYRDLLNKYQLPAELAIP